MMKIERRYTVCSCLLAGLVAWPLAQRTHAEEKSADQAQALLQEVRSRELERQRAAKSKEVERINEDLAKLRKESDDLEKSIESMSATTSESSEQLAKLSSKKQRLIQTLELLALQIQAEKLKLEGLQLLSDAQNKALAALAKRIEQTDLRSSIEAGELKLLSDPPPVAEGNGDAKEGTQSLKSDLADLKKKLANLERSVSTTRSAAREAMQAASLKLEAAHAADERAKAKSTELGFDTPATPENKDQQVLDVPRATRAR